MKLKLRLTLWFLAISLIPMSLVMYFSYNMTRNALMVQIFNRLESVANVQQNRVEALLGERKRDLAALTDRPQVRALLQEYWADPDEPHRDALDRALAGIRLDEPHFRDIALLDLEGNVFASSNRSLLGRNLSAAPWFTAGRTQADVQLEYDEVHNQLAIRMAGPLIESDETPSAEEGARTTEQRPAGVCMLLTEADSLLNLAADRSGLGDSGEIILTRREPSGDVLALTPRRRSVTAAMQLRVNHVGRDSVGVRELTTIDREVHEGINFHGTAVLAASRHMGVARWSIVVSIDKEEAFTPIQRFRDLVTWALVALMLLTVLASFSLARSITEPLDDLTHAAQHASSGDLSTRVPDASDDELGILAKAFNHMSERLEAMHLGLETKVAERTAELESANTRLQQLDQMKSEFLATMTHELRTPLNSILGFSEILLSESDGFDVDQREQLRCIFGSAKHLLKIIEEILEVSRIEAGKMITESQWFSLGDLVRQAADILHPQASQKGLRLTATIEGPEPLLLCSDPHRLLRVLVNLIGNSVKFTARGAVSVAVRHDDEVVMEVRDTGIGIRPADMGVLFQPFKQVDSSASRQFEGTGLGLYYSKKVVGLLGGTITVESVWQEGSVFTVRLPVSLPGAPPRPLEADQAIFAD